MKKLTFYLSIIAGSAVTMAAEIVEVSSTSPIFFLTPLEIILLIIFFLLLVIAIIKNRRMYFVSDKYHKKTVKGASGKAKHFRSHYQSNENNESKAPVVEEHVVVENPSVSVSEVTSNGGDKAVDRIIASQKEFVDELKHLNFDNSRREVVIREEPHVQPVVAPQYFQPVACERPVYHESKPRVIIKKTPMNFFFGKNEEKKTHKTHTHKKHKAHKPTKKRINWKVHVPFLRKIMKNTLSHHDFDKNAHVEVQAKVSEYNPSLSSKDKQLWQTFEKENYLPNESDFKSFGAKKDMWPEVNHFNSAFFKNKKNKVYVDESKNVGIKHPNKKKGVIKYLNSVYYD